MGRFFDGGRLTRLTARGYRRKPGEDYANRLLRVEDLLDGNALLDENGVIRVIDPVIFLQ